MERGVIIIVSANYSSPPAGGLTGEQFVTHVTLTSPGGDAKCYYAILCPGTLCLRSFHLFES